CCLFRATAVTTPAAYLTEWPPSRNRVDRKCRNLSRIAAPGGSGFVEDVRGLDAEPRHALANLRPLVLEEAGALGRAQLLGRALADEHADPALDADQPVGLELLVGLGHGERIGALLGGEGAHRGQHLALRVASLDD